MVVRGFGGAFVLRRRMTECGPVESCQVLVESKPTGTYLLEMLLAPPDPPPPVSRLGNRPHPR
jgi:hypothetical protein